MISEPTLKGFDKFFGFAYKSGMSLFKWDKNQRIFLGPGTVGKNGWLKVYCWWFSMIILIIKTVFLGYVFFGILIPSGDLAKIVFQMVFMMTYLCAVGHNTIFWLTRNEFVALFRRAVVFSSKAHADYLTEVGEKYPMKDDKLGPNIKMGSGITFIFTISVFFLSLGNPGLAPFFAFEFSWIAEKYLGVKIVLSILEAYIMAFAWIGNIQGAIIIPNLAHLLAFWLNELNVNGTGGQVSTSTSKIRNVEEIMKTYRELQVLALEYNSCFSDHIACLFSTAFVNQTSVNYGSLRLYNSLSFASWVGCPNLAISGLVNLFQMQMVLAMPYEVSQKTIKSWHDLRQFKDYKILRHMKRFIKSCPIIKVNHGSFTSYDRGTAIQYVDSLIDKTVTLLMWQ